MSKRRSDSHHLDDAQEHLDVLREHLSRGSLDDALIRDAVSHRLEVAIDAIGKVDQGLLQSHAPADWHKIVGMRNILAHQYTDLDQVILQNTIDNRLDELSDLVERLHKAAADAAEASDSGSG